MNKVNKRMAVLSQGKELQLAIEGKGTNLRIWTRGESVLMRLDIYKQSSVPLHTSACDYLEKPNDVIYKLAHGFGFTSSVNNVSRILEITKGLKERAVKEW